MTDARFPERWLNDRRVLGLSDADFRSFTMCNAWCAANRTDGIVLPSYISMMPWMTTETPARLVAARLWVVQSDGWLINGWLIDQTSRAQLEAAEQARQKDAARNRANRQRNRDVPAGQPDVHPDVQVDVQVDVHRDVHLESTRTGQDRLGQEVLAPAELEIAPRSAGPVSVVNECQQCGKPSQFSLTFRDGLPVCRRCMDHPRATVNGRPVGAGVVA